MPRLCGYDVNGWSDMAARNWIIRPDGEEEEVPAFLGKGDILGSVVQVGSGGALRWIGGMPAGLAPHGLGPGWGEVGSPDRRLAVRELLESQFDDHEAVAAAFVDIVRGARFNVAAIDEGFSEKDQERLLGALKRARVEKPMLVWRSVLAVLSWISKNKALEGQRIGIVSQSAEGFSVQHLCIRKAAVRNGEAVAPERRNAATEVSSAFGYRHLAKLAQKTVLDGHAPGSQTEHLLNARSIGRLTLGRSATPEILRNHRGDWDVLDVSSGLDLPVALLPSQVFDPLADCDHVLFESLAAAEVHAAALKACETAAGRSFEILSPDAVAAGALEAARRSSKGEPVFFDFLPKISTIVVSGGEAASYDLIDQNETLEAGRFYRSPKPARLALPGGQSTLSVYVRKEAEQWPRKASVEIGEPARAPVPVSLWVEQKPAAGRARILLDSPELDRQFTVDWEAAEIVEKSWEQVIEDLASPPPSIPNRLVLKCGLHAWEDNQRQTGLIDLLAENQGHPAPDWQALADRLSSRPFGEYCISSDGDVPAAVPQETRKLLDTITAQALREAEGRAAGSVNTDDNQSLRFLTWQFRRCPSRVADLLLNCIEEDDQQKLVPPFITHHMHAVLVYQGTARILVDKEQELRLLNAIIARPVKTWRWRCETAALAILLSRSRTAPELLTRSDLETMAKRVIMEFAQNRGTDYTKFHYAPFLLAGLLRYRMKEKRALLAGVEPLADELRKASNSVIADLERKGTRSARFEKASSKYLPIMNDLLSELEGKGSNPDLLMDIYNSA